MSREFLNRNHQQNSDNNNNIENQKKIDPVAQLKWLNNQQVDAGWGLDPAQMFAREENENDLEALQMKSLASSMIASGPINPNQLKKANLNTYIVKKGETLGALALKFKTTIHELKTLNYSKLQKWGTVEGFNTGDTINLPALSSGIESLEVISPVKILNDCFQKYKLGTLNMPNFARAVLPYVSEYENEIIDIFNQLSWNERDNFAYALTINSDNAKLSTFGKDLLKRMSSELESLLTLKRDENIKQKERIEQLIGEKKSSPVEAKNKDTQISTSSCWDSSSNNNIAKIHSKLKPLAFKFINVLDKNHNIKIRAYQGLRTFEEQNELYKKGRDDEGKTVDKKKIITNAKGGQSYHNFGLAIDVVEIKEGKALWKNENWELIGKVGKECGFGWGGDWSGFVDKPHFEYTMNYSYQELQDLKKQGKWKL